MAKQRSSLPEDRIGRYRELLTEEEAAALETAIQKSPPTAIRFNPLKINPQHMADEFHARKKLDASTSPILQGWVHASILPASARPNPGGSIGILLHPGCRLHDPGRVIRTG